MIDLNSSLVIQIVNFIVLILVMNYVCYRPLRGIIDKRKKTMGSLKDEADRAGQKLREIEQELTKIMADAQADGFARRGTLKTQAEDERSARLAALGQKLAGEAETASKRFREEAAQARQGLLGQVDAFARSLAEKLLGRSLS